MGKADDENNPKLSFVEAEALAEKLIADLQQPTAEQWKDFVRSLLGALVALIRRAKEGGSYHVRVSLCQTAMWYQDFGDVTMEERRSRNLVGRMQQGMASSGHPLAGFDDVNKSVVLLESESPLGIMTHMAPVIQYSKTKAYSERKHERQHVGGCDGTLLGIAIVSKILSDRDRNDRGLCRRNMGKSYEVR